MTVAAAAQQQVLRARAVVPPTPLTTRRFTVWCGVNISPGYRSVNDLAVATRDLAPTGEWDDAELLLKAGEGGSWQSAFDPHPLAISGPDKLATLRSAGPAAGITITPYVVVRGRPAWITGEQAMIRSCVEVAGRCVLNVEPGAQYWNGPGDPAYIRAYLQGCGVPASSLELCTIPRAAQVAELGGVACLQAWTDPTLVGSASWETYGLAAPGSSTSSLQVDAAIPRLDGWGVPPGSQYRIPVVQRDERARWAETPWCAYGMQIWFIGGN